MNEAHVVIAQVNARGDLDSPLVLAEYKQIVDMLEYDRTLGKSMSPLEMFRDASQPETTLHRRDSFHLRKRGGQHIATYYLGAELATAGIVDSTQQLKAVSMKLLGRN